MEFPRLLMEVREELGGTQPTEEQPDQNAPDGLPPIDRSIDSCS